MVFKNVIIYHMNTKRFPAHLAALVILIAILHIVATTYSWYWRLPPLDMFMHTLGGLWISGVVLWILSRSKSEEESYKKINSVAVILGVILIGLLWEGFEFAIDMYTNARGYDVVDGMSDLVMDIIGGLLGLVMWNRKYKKYE